jgi:hypothetical protein
MVLQYDRRFQGKEHNHSKASTYRNKMLRNSRVMQVKEAVIEVHGRGEIVLYVILDRSLSARGDGSGAENTLTCGLVYLIIFK